MLIELAQAQSHIVQANSLVDRINNAILYPLITLLLGAAVVVFIWGAFQYLSNAEDSAERVTGQRHMLYGIIGIVVMVSAATILAVAVRTLFGDAAVPNSIQP